MKRLATNPRFAFTFLLVSLIGWGCMEAPAHIELDAMEEPTVTMTQAQLAAHDAEIRIQAAREVLSARECTWRDTFKSQPTKRKAS